MITDLKEKVALVTGAGSGIGRAMALAFAREGMKLAVVDVNPESLEGVSAQIKAIGVDVLPQFVDVSNREQMKDLANNVFERFGNVNLLCNNAGIGTGGMLSEVHLENWDWIMGVNLYGVIHGIHFFLKRMLKSGEECHIVNTASIAGLLATGEQALYSVTKFGVVALSETLRLQLKSQQAKVGVSVLCPGIISTNILENSEALAETREGLYEPPEELQQIITPLLDNFRKRIKGGIDPDIVAHMVIDSVRKDRQFIVTNPDFARLMELKTRSVIKDALDLQASMKAQGVGSAERVPVTYTHLDPAFSITYPGEWVVQGPTALMNHDFMAVSETWFPNLIVRIVASPADGLLGAVKAAASYIAATLGAETRIISETPTKLRDGTDAIEGEIDIQSPDGAYQFTNFVLAAQKNNKIIRVSLGMFRILYDDAARERLKEIAYSLTLD